MNVRYYKAFKGLDEVLNRVEILTNGSAQAHEVKTTLPTFILNYQQCKKITPVRGAQATIKLISETNFQFADLYTEDVQGYAVKFYRAGKLHWIGWLDSEFYEEKFSDYPPYEVEFSAADFNIWERLKYRDVSEKAYTDIVPLIVHLKRCFEKLNLPFQKLYIGCTTVPNDVVMSASETSLHVLHMMSANFYDEDNEPMTCREVVESVLQPFGLTMVQKDANVYVYDYNTIKQGLPMKRYEFSTFIYEADEIVDFNLGNLVEIGFVSTDGGYGFEEMVNNVTITSSLYANKSIISAEAKESNLSESVAKTETDVLKVEEFSECEEIEKLESLNFIVYTNKDSENTIIGAHGPYNPFGGSDYSKKARFRVKSTIPVISTDSKKYSLLLKMNCYVSGSENPFEYEGKGESDAVMCEVKGNLYTTDGDGSPLYYYQNIWGKHQWLKCSPDFDKACTKLVFCNQTVKGSNIYNRQLTNSNVIDTSKAFESVKQKDYGCGVVIPINSDIYGQIVFEISGAIVYKWMPLDHSDDNFFPNGGEKVKDIIYNGIEIKVVDEKKDDVPTDDYEFKSYVKKKVKSDFDDITLKCISANEEKVPIGKANILKKVADHYELQLSYTRAGQTDILERLLMCTIHSNFTTKNEKVTVDVKMTDNPALSYVSCAPILSGEYLVTGCTLDYHNAKTTITAVGYSDDTARLSNIPYD